MAFDIDPKNLLEETDFACQQRDAKLNGVDDSIARYQGPHRSGLHGRTIHDENTEFEFISYMGSQLAYARPTVSIESPILSKQNDVLALEVAINRWTRDTHISQEMTQAVVDYCVAWAVYVVSERPAPEMGETCFKDYNGKTTRGIKNRPYAKRLPFKTAFKDPLSTSAFDHRYAGHDEITDKSNLVKAAEADPKRWYLDVVKALPVNADLERAGRNTNLGAPSRDEVCVRHLWVSDAEIDWKEHSDIKESERNLYHGMLFRLAPAMSEQGVTGQLLGPAEPFFGPRWGPYTFIGAHIVPDDSNFMSPIQPALGSIEMLNAVNGTAVVSMEHFKRFVVCGGAGDNDLATMIRDGKHDHVYDIPGFEKDSIQQFVIGGLENQMAVHLAFMQDGVNRKLGLSAVKRGAATGDASATENVLADQAANARMAVMERNWDAGHSMMLRTVAWYFWHSDRVAQPVSAQEYQMIGGQMRDLMKVDANGQPVLVKGQPDFEQPMIYGGPGPGADPADHADSFDSLDIEVLAYSRKYTSEQDMLAKFTFLQNYAFQAAAIAGTPQGSVVDWAFLNRQAERATGIYGVRNVINLHAAAQLAESQLLAQNAEMNEQDGPQMAKNAGGSAGAQAGPKRLPDGSAGGGGRQNAPKQQNTMPGRSSGGASGNAASKKVGV